MSNDQNQNQPAPSGSQLQAVGAFIWDLTKILLIALVIIVPFRVFIAEPFVVSGHSMLPNYYDKDYLIIDRLSYRTSEPRRGDVVVLKFPKDTSQFFIKRIVGLPGEQVRIFQGGVYVYNKEHPNGIKLAEPYLSAPVETNGRTDITRLGSDEYFVLGDNRTASSDSRVWGILPRRDIIGKAWLRVLPVSRFGKPIEVKYNL